MDEHTVFFTSLYLFIFLLFIFLHILILLVDHREERAFRISGKALAMDLPMKQKLFLAVEGDLQAARVAEPLALNL